MKLNMLCNIVARSDRNQIYKLMLIFSLLQKSTYLWRIIFFKHVGRPFGSWKDACLSLSGDAYDIKCFNCGPVYGHKSFGRPTHCPTCNNLLDTKSTSLYLY